jgi:hypothetical protein
VPFLFASEYDLCIYYLLIPASNSLPEATRLINCHPNARSILVDMLDQEQVGRLVEKADVIIRYVEPCVLQSIE